ncbi:glutaminase B [Aliikangiella sp. IMCC44653]
MPLDLSQKDLQSLLNSIEEKSRKKIGLGKVANYIPLLASVNPNQFGIALCDINGNITSAGDAQKPFSIQSISKLFSLVMAMQIYADKTWLRVGREPSGQRFNSLIQLESENGIPRNPFINAGALLICDLLESRCSTPNFQLLSLLRELANNPNIHVNTDVALSEMQHGSRNAAMAYLMKSYDNFHNEVDTVLRSYTHHCAIQMNCIDLAKSTLFLANQGKTIQGKSILTPQQSKRMNALLVTCGLYDAAGDFAFRVGLPGKSGVGGGIVAIKPGQYSVCVWSPELNQAGNSLAGTHALQLLTNALGTSIF